jgi:drug/metabolite transporter (DMT)-like permease
MHVHASNMRVDLASTLRLLTLAVLWGSSFTFIKISLEGLAPAQVVLFRLMLGAMLLLAFAAVRRVRLPAGARTWGLITVAAVFGNVAPFLLLSYGEQTANAGVAGALVGATPLLTLGLAAAVIPSERLGRNGVLGLLIGFVGVLLVVAPWRDFETSVGGSLACLGAAASYAAGFVFVRRFISPLGIAALGLAAAQTVAATALQAPLTPLLGWESPDFTARVAGSLLALGLLGTGFAYILYFRLIADVGASRASSVNYVVPVVAVALGVVVLDEPVTLALVLGGLLVLASMAYARRQPQPEPSRPAADAHASSARGASAVAPDPAPTD